MKARILLATFALAAAASPPPAAATVAATKVSPDGQWRVELTDERRHQVFELWAVPAVGGVRRQIGRTVPALEDVRNDFLFSADSRTVVYVQGETASGSHFRLWSTAIDRMAGQVISQPAPQLGVGFDLPIVAACSGREVRFRSDPVIDETFEWFVVPMVGGPIRPWDGCRIFVDGFESGNQGAWQIVLVARHRNAVGERDPVHSRADPLPAQRQTGAQ